LPLPHKVIYGRSERRKKAASFLMVHATVNPGHYQHAPLVLSFVLGTKATTIFHFLSNPTTDENLRLSSGLKTPLLRPIKEHGRKIPSLIGPFGITYRTIRVNSNFW
jgi:hypothetical protein